jgi:hypothetical protein
MLEARARGDWLDDALLEMARRLTGGRTQAE